MIYKVLSTAWAFPWCECCPQKPDSQVLDPDGSLGQWLSNVNGGNSDFTEVTLSSGLSEQWFLGTTSDLVIRHLLPISLYYHSNAPFLLSSDFRKNNLRLFQSGKFFSGDSEGDQILASLRKLIS